jgi:cytochrome c oxidase cbb3-type subunit 4
VDVGTVRGLVTLALMLAFVGLVIWAYSSRRKKDFDEAARLPFDEDPAQNKGAHSDE